MKRDFAGGPVIKTPASASDAGVIPGWGVKIPHASQPKKNKTKQYIKKEKAIL